MNIPLPTKIFILDHLRVMLRAGIPIGRALENLGADVAQPKLAAILRDLRATVERGVSLTDALAAHPELLPPVAVELIRSGEQSGTLEKTLAEVTMQLRKDHDLRSRVQGALLYPAIIIGAMSIIGTGVIGIILPRLALLFRDVTVMLPLPTRMLLAFSAFVGSYGLLVVVVLALACALLAAFSRSMRGRALGHRMLLAVPGRIGVLAKEVNLARTFRTLAGLLATDIPIVHALELTASTLSNTRYRSAVRAAATRVAHGEALGAVLREERALFPPTSVQVVTVGEETGTLAELFNELANFYEADVDRSLQNLTTIIEPILILIIGVGVAFLAVAVLQPMYTIAQAI